MERDTREGATGMIENWDDYSDGDRQHDAAVEDAMIRKAEVADRLAALGDHRAEWQKRADEDWDYYNDDDGGF